MSSILIRVSLEHLYRDICHCEGLIEPRELIGKPVRDGDGNVIGLIEDVDLRYRYTYLRVNKDAFFDGTNMQVSMEVKAE